MAYFQQRLGNWREIVKRKGHDRITRTFDAKVGAGVDARSIENEMERGVLSR